MDAMTTIRGIVFETHHVPTPISLRRISTVPLEKLFGLTRLHVKTHQTMSAINKTMLVVSKIMDIGQAKNLVDPNPEVKNHRLAHGEKVDPCQTKFDL
jgi:hypothetical protein